MLSLCDVCTMLIDKYYHTEYNPQVQYTPETSEYNHNDSSSNNSIGSAQQLTASGSAAAGVFKDQIVDILLNSDVYGGAIGGAIGDQLQPRLQQLMRPAVLTADMVQTDIRNRCVMISV